MSHSPSTLDVGLGLVTLSLFTAAGAGMLLLLRRQLEGQRLRLSDLLALAPTGFAIGYGALLAVLIVGFGASLTAYVVAAVIFLVLGLGAVLVVLIGRRVSRVRARARAWKVLALVVSVTFCFSTVPQLILGNLPFSVSDNWTHLSYINALLRDNSTRLVGAAMPGEKYGLTFAPHHVFLAGAARIAGVQPMAIWFAARLFFPFLLALAFAACVAEVAPRLLFSPWRLITVLAPFFLLFPVQDGLIRGTANYATTSFVFLLLLLRLAFRATRLRARRSLAALGLAMLGLTGMMIVTHLVEVMLAVLAVTPYALYHAIRRRRLKHLVLVVLWLASTSVLSAVFLHVAFHDVVVPLSRTHVSFGKYWAIFSPQFEAFVGWSSLVAGVILLPFIPSRFNEIRAFLVCSLATATFLGPLNPLLADTYHRVVGTNLDWRVAFVFPVYLALSLGTIGAVEIAIRGARRERPVLAGGALALCCVAVAGIGLQARFVFGWDGGYTYYASDSLSQLRLYPALYSFLGTRQREVILGDTFTSAPINAITRNYIFTHRPWSEGADAGRFAIAEVTLADPNTPETRQVICRNRISLLLVNRQPVPTTLERESRKFAFLRSAFYSPGTDYNHVPFLHPLGTFDGVGVLSVDRAMVCATSTTA